MDRLSPHHKPDMPTKAVPESKAPGPLEPGYIHESWIEHFNEFARQFAAAFDLPAAAQAQE